jgi:hypothetical protein
MDPSALAALGVAAVVALHVLVTALPFASAYGILRWRWFAWVHVSIPDRLKDVAFMLKDSNSTTGGWEYALFDYDPASDRFTPNGTGAACGAGCHTIVKAKDVVFTRFEKR